MDASRLWRSHRGKRWLWFGALWVSWIVLQAPYTAIRSVGDDLWKAHDIDAYESAMFGGTEPGRFLQAHLYAHDLAWLDYAGYLAHGLWFGVPFAFGIVIMRYQRERLMEFLTMLNVLVYLCTLSFVFFPVRPPWMDEGIVRVLAVRNADYISLDNNPMAAFPSLHAALPCAVALFYFTRCDRKVRPYAWLVAAYTLWVSFSIVYLGEHWVIDVLGGYAVATVSVWLCVSPRMHRVWARIPGDPVGRLSALNARLCAPAEAGRADEEPEEAFQPVPQAA